MPGPLSGVRVLELARILAGPWAGQILADLGADVVKVERTGAGDDTRGWGPPFVEGADGEPLSAAYYHACNRGKRSVAVDFETEAGRRIVKKLAARSDIVIENFKTGGLAKFGLDYERLSKDNPDIIYCSITGFGQDGPYSHRAGYDLLIQGMGGLMDLTGEPNGEPMRGGIAFADIITGIYSALAILAALNDRITNGKGAYIDMALLDTQVAILANHAASYFASGKAPKRMGNAHPAIVPYQVFPVSDGHVTVACGNDTQFARLITLLGAPELARDERYITNAGRVLNRGTLIPHMLKLTARVSRADLLGHLEKAGVPGGPINTLEDVFDDPQVIARQIRIDLPSKFARGGSISSVRSPITINGMRMAADRPPPLLGEHTQEVLAEIGES
ncbi:putative enzyme [Mesorhizobium plurifarium]|uniref:Putative enzyme n=1 Tax=Mesorhizobium plurifarium TaxID=69974 RepID=A0A090GKE4_MESPL|nr:putative enzyme [Mesorhizobium sp. SOD10]CDX35283.1 putative enzyme [Mesorhizobium plurifarium]